MEKLKTYLAAAQAAYSWARGHKAVVLVATAAVLHVVAMVWTDVPSDLVLDVVRGVVG